jgi:exodeoxyribonuclease V beta subunit
MKAKDMQRFDCLDRKTKIFGKFFLEASAGTGKTFAIEHIFVRLLLEHTDNKYLRVEDILVVTFTKAATRDLRMRVKSNMEKCLNILTLSLLNKTIKADIFDYLYPIIDDRTKLLSSISRLKEAILFFDQAQIFTIHSFCLHVLREHAFETNNLLTQSADENIDNYYILKKEVRDFLSYCLTSKQYHPLQAQILIEKYKSTEDLCHKLIMNGDNRSLPVEKSFNDLYDEFLTLIKSWEKEDNLLIRVEEDFAKLFPCYKKIAKHDYNDLLQPLLLLAKVIEEKKCSLNDFELLASSKLKVFDFLNDNNKKKRVKSPSPSLLQASDFIIKAKNSIFKIIQRVIDPYLIFCRLSYDCCSKIQALLEEKDIFSYDELLIKMHKSLDNLELLKLLQQKFRVAIIDEFQDTDPMQWDIFKKIFLYKSLSFFLVGDPKQSIYSFRSADLYTYLTAAKDMGENNLFHLDTNYRSGGELVDSINELFSCDIAGNWMVLPKKNKHITYHPVKTGQKDSVDLTDGKKPLHFFVAKGSSKGKKWPTTAVEEEQLFPYVVQQILLLKDKIDYDQIAILVKDRYQAQRAVDILKDNNIPFTSKSHVSICDTPSFIALKEMLEAIIFSKDRSKVLIAIMGPFIGWGCDAIKTITKEEMVYVLHKFHELYEVLDNKGAAHFFRHFLQCKWKDNDITVLERMMSYKDLSLYNDTMQLIEMFLDRQYKKSLSLKGVLLFFDKLLEHHPENEGNKRKPYCNTTSGIAVMTTHMSKGLEFSVIFAIGAATRTPSPERPLLAEATQGIDEIDAEKLRQFYVAITRAKTRVYVPIAIDTTDNKVAQQQASPVELFLAISNVDSYSKIYSFIASLDMTMLQHHLDKLTNASYEVLESKLTYPLCENAPEKDLTIHPSRQFTNKYAERHILSFSNIVKPQHSTVMAQQEEERETIIFSSNNIIPGATTGVLLHRVFEEILKCGEANFFHKSVYSKIVDKVVSATFLEEKKDMIYEMVHRVMTTSLIRDGNDSFSIKDIAIDDMHVEIEFIFPMTHSLMKGYIDLVFRYKDKYYLVDWKSNWLGDSSNNYDKNNLLRAMDDNNYYLQGAIYKEALEKYLGKTDFNLKFGGMFYVFLRGLSIDSSNSGIVYFFPDAAMSKKIEEERLCMD